MNIGVFFGSLSPEHDVSIINGQLISSAYLMSGFKHINSPMRGTIVKALQEGQIPLKVVKNSTLRQRMVALRTEGSLNGFFDQIFFLV